MARARVRPAVEIQRVAGQPPVVAQPEERSEAGQQRRTASPRPMRRRSGREQEIDRHEGQQEPAFVARQGGRRRRRAGAHAAPQPCVSRKRTVKYSSARGRRRNGLRHGDGLQVEQVGIEGEQRRGGAAPRRRESKMRRTAANRNVPARTKQKPREWRRRGRCATGVHAHQRQHQPVRQRQPDRADLVVARRAGIHHAARDIQVRFGVAVVEQSSRASRQTADGARR